MLLHDLVTALSQVGLILNANKTVVLTNEAQQPQHLQLPSGERIAILEHNSGQKWLGCILTAQSSKLHHVDVKHHLQQASEAFFANRWILQDHQVSIATRLKYFDKVVSTVACFAAGHRAVYTNDLVNMDVSYRKLCRQIVGPPRNGGNLIWTTSSTSAGFECKLNFLYILCYLFKFLFFSTPVPNRARHLFGVQARLDSTCAPIGEILALVALHIFRNGPPAGLQAQLNSTQFNSTQLNSTLIFSVSRMIVGGRAFSPMQICLRH